MSISKKIRQSIDEQSWIRRMFEEGAALKKQYGKDNVRTEQPSGVGTQIDVVVKHRLTRGTGYQEVYVVSTDMARNPARVRI